MAFNHYSIGKARHKPHEFYEYEPHLIGALLENWAECVFPLGQDLYRVCTRLRSLASLFYCARPWFRVSTE